MIYNEKTDIRIAMTRFMVVCEKTQHKLNFLK